MSTPPGLSPVAVIVLAAGQGTRMKSGLAKVLHEVAGRPLLHHVLAAVAHWPETPAYVVVGHQHERVAEAAAQAGHRRLHLVHQEEQRGTGHAVRVALEAAGGDLPEGPVLVVPGDAPLLAGETLRQLLDRHRATDAAVTLLTATVDDPRGYGRVVRDADGHPTAIVEERDADDAIRAVREIGTSVYVFDRTFLDSALSRIKPDNAAGEEYLTDVVGIAAEEGRVIAAVAATDPAEALGVNDREQLSMVARALRDRIVRRWQHDGVSILDPLTTWIDVDVTLEPDVTVEPNVTLKAGTRIAAGARIGPDTTLIATSVGRGASVVRAHCVEAEIGDGATVGPFAYLRPGTRLAARAKVGTFVEVKNADIGEGSRVPHLTYVGDATIGVESNIGASSVFVNYDGVSKHRSTIGDHVRTGSDNTFVAPVTVGDGAYTGAGAVIREDVPPGALAVSAGPQRNIDGWVARKRPGSPSDRAARAAAGEGESEPQADPTDEQGAPE